MFIPSLSSSRLLQHPINEVRPLWLPEHPVVVAVVPVLDLVNVRGKEAVQGMSKKICFKVKGKLHLTTMKIRLESMMLFSCGWFSFG